MNAADFARRLAAARVAARLTQDEAAKKAGMVQPAWARLESGRRMPRLDIAARAAAAVGISLDALVGRTPAPATSPWPSYADRYAIAEGCESGRWYIMRVAAPRFFAGVWEPGDDEAALASICYVVGGYQITDPVWFDEPPADPLPLMREAAAAMRRYDRLAE